MKKTFTLVVGLMLVLSGCTYVGTREAVNPLESQHINTDKAFYLIYPQNGIQKTYFTANLKENEESASQVVNTFQKKFYEKVGSLTISENNLSLDDGFRIAKARGDDYLINMDINSWKDAFYMTCRPSQQQGATTVLDQALDSADVTISIYDVKTQKLLNRQRVQNSGCPVIFFGVLPLGKMSPSSRFAASLDKWFENLQQ